MAENIKIVKATVKQIQAVSQSLAPCRGGRVEFVVGDCLSGLYLMGHWLKRAFFVLFCYTLAAPLSSSSLFQSDLFVSNAVPTHVHESLGEDYLLLTVRSATL